MDSLDTLLLPELSRIVNGYLFGWGHIKLAISLPRNTWFNHHFWVIQDNIFWTSRGRVGKYKVNVQYQTLPPLKLIVKDCDSKIDYCYNDSPVSGFTHETVIWKKHVFVNALRSSRFKRRPRQIWCTSNALATRINDHKVRVWWEADGKIAVFACKEPVRTCAFWYDALIILDTKGGLWRFQSDSQHADRILGDDVFLAIPNKRKTSICIFDHIVWVLQGKDLWYCPLQKNYLEPRNDRHVS